MFLGNRYVCPPRSQRFYMCHCMEKPGEKDVGKAKVLWEDPMMQQKPKPQKPKQQKPKRQQQQGVVLPFFCLKNMIGKQVYARINNGGAFVGTLMGVDRHLSLTLRDVVFLVEEDGTQKQQFQRDVVVVRGGHIVYVYPLETEKT